jgi:ribonuclease P protein subunit POP4
MPLTPESLPRHELVGLHAEVVSASSKDFVGITGDVVTETTKTLGIGRESAETGSAETEADEQSADAGGDTRVSHVPKAAATFEFELPTAGGVRVVTVEGEKLEARPARRTEQTGDSKWR